MHVQHRPRIRFARPPVIEVACGVTYSLPEALKTAHVGAFWASIKSNYPVIQDQPPLAVLIEKPGRVSTNPGLSFSISETLPLRRTWFLSLDGATLVQLQEERLLVNWRRVEANEAFDYPSYDVVIAKFHAVWEQFQTFAQEVGLGKPTILQLELVYVNGIDLNEGQKPEIFESLLIDHARSKASARFLPAPEVFNWQTSYNMGNDTGRLHVVAYSAVKGGTTSPSVRLDLTARGLPQNTESGGIAAWFDQAHEWITHGFADITSREVQDTLWGRQE